jgi:hypothetical protein
MSDPVPAVVEATATGEAAAIFADIRATYRIGVVNLIWRHLASFEGALRCAEGATKALARGTAIWRMVVNGGVLLASFSPAPRTASSSP